MFCDSHCHLDYPEFQPDFADMLARAQQAGVKKFLTISTKLETWDRVQQTAARDPNIFCSVGIHPHEAATHSTVTADWLIEETQKPKVVAIGECGLDYYYNHSPANIQQDVFKRHIAAAQATGLPLIIHTRDAEDDTIRLLSQEGKGTRGVLHCFTGTQKLADAGLAIGYYISFSGIITFKKSEELRAIAKTVPLDRVLIETDAPYLAPEPYRGKRNEPSYVVKVAEKLAEVYQISITELGQRTTENFHRLFSKIPT